MASWMQRLKFWNRGPRERQFKSLAALLEGYRAENPIGDDYGSQAREGYLKNVIAFRAISSIALAVANIPRIVKVKGKEVKPEHPAAKLLRQPNPWQSGKDLIRLVTMHRQINGNLYLHGVEVVSDRKKIMELKALRPDRVRIRTASDGVPVAYEYELNGKTQTFPIDPNTWVADVLHMKEPHPLDDLYGLSPLRAASLGISQHNESSNWNLKLLGNSAKPAGVMTLKEMGEGSTPPSQKELDDISSRFNEKYSGPQAAGKVMFLNFDMQWQSLGMSPVDMDWINGKNSTARDIALALGYPPYLLGLAEGSTFANVREAKLSLYQETVIPLAQAFDESLSNWLSIKNGEEIEIRSDLDQVEALAPQREPMLEQSRKDFESGIISANEARALRKYDEVDGGDALLVPAGKLPIDFDASGLSDQQFKAWLMGQGVAEKQAADLVAASERLNGDQQDKACGDVPADAGRARV